MKRTSAKELYNKVKNNSKKKSVSSSMLDQEKGPTPGELTRQGRRKSTLANEYQNRGGKFFKPKDNSKTEEELGFESETADLLGDLTGVGEKDPDKRRILEKRKSLEYLTNQDMKDKNFKRSDMRTKNQERAAQELLDAEEMSDLNDESDLEKELGLDVKSYRNELDEEDPESEEFIDKLLEGYDAKSREEDRGSDRMKLLRRKRAR